MATPTFACGFECGVSNGAHFVASGGVTFDTTTKRSGARSLRLHPSAAIEYVVTNAINSAADHIIVARFYINVVSAPSGDYMLAATGQATDIAGLGYKASDGKVYAARGTYTGAPTAWGATGVTLSAGWHRVDLRVNSTTNPWVVDVEIDGTALGQLSIALNGLLLTAFYLGQSVSTSCDVYFDDFLLSQTSGDYPLGGGYILSYIPNADGTHNIAGSADFYEGTNATPKLHDIYNGGAPLSDVYTYLDERPLPSTSVDFLNIVAPPNGTDYVEVGFENSSEGIAPRLVEQIVCYHGAGGSGTSTWTARFMSGTSTDDHPRTDNPGSVLTYFRSGHAVNWDGGPAWTEATLNAITLRTLCSDASPDVYVDAVMLEVEFPASDTPAETNLAPAPTAAATAVPAPTLQVIGPTQTFTPDATAAASAVPAVTLGHVLTRIPDATATATTVVAVTLAHARTFAPDATAAITAVPDPTVQTIGAQTDLSPDAVATATAVPVPTMDSALTVASGNAATATDVPTPLVGHSLTLAAAVAAAVTATAAPSLAHTITLASGNASTATEVPAPTLYVGPAPQSFAPDAVTTTTEVPAIALAHALTLTPAAVATATDVPAPTLDVAGVVTLAPDAVATTTTIAPPTLGHQYALAPDAVTTASAVAPTTLSRSYGLAPDAVATTTVAPAPSVGLRLDLAPTPSAAATAVPAPSVEVVAGERTLTPDAVAATTAVPQVAVQVLGITTLAPDAVAAGTVAVAPQLGLVTTISAPAVPTATLAVSVALAHARTLSLAATPATTRVVAVWAQVGPVELGTPGIHLVTTRHGGSALTAVVGNVGAARSGGGVRHVATGGGSLSGEVTAGKVKA